MATIIAKRLALSNVRGIEPIFPHQTKQVCAYSVQPKVKESSSKYKVVVVGGGSGGCAIAAKFASSLGKDIAVVEPQETHYYQPIWTLVGAGLKDFGGSGRPMTEVLPESCTWIKEKATVFDPENNCLKLGSGEKIHYDYLVLGLGMQVDYDKIPGLEAAFQEDPMVASNYHPKWVQKTNPALQSFKGGNAIFTFPNTGIKCPGAPQKIMYLAEEIFRKNGVRDKSHVIYNSSLPVIFAQPKYAKALWEVVKDRGIQVNLRTNLAAVDHKTKTATFELLDEGNKTFEEKYDFLHATPPMSAPSVLKSSPLANEAGFVAVDKHTLQHDKFSNVFGIGDCTSVPTPKTAAAAACQSGILHDNLTAVMEGKQTKPLYDGYTSCPLVTSSNKCILAEFEGFSMTSLETFPVIRQDVERQTSYWLKADMLPQLYWRMHVKGKWNGPRTFRKLFHLGMGK